MLFFFRFTSDFDGFFDLDTVHPLILVFGAGGHDGTGGVSAKLGDAAVEQVDLIEKVHRVHRQPLVAVLTLKTKTKKEQIKNKIKYKECFF